MLIWRQNNIATRLIDISNIEDRFLWLLNVNYSFHIVIQLSLSYGEYTRSKIVSPLHSFLFWVHIKQYNVLFFHKVLFNFINSVSYSKIQYTISLLIHLSTESMINKRPWLTSEFKERKKRKERKTQLIFQCRLQVMIFVVSIVH